eukprot:COSAG01_NODE_432_length_17115_cov_126.732593_16_plen_61_part_00
MNPLRMTGGQDSQSCWLDRAGVSLALDVRKVKADSRQRRGGGLHAVMWPASQVPGTMHCT